MLHRVCAIGGARKSSPSCHWRAHSTMTSSSHAPVVVYLFKPMIWLNSNFFRTKRTHDSSDSFSFPFFKNNYDSIQFSVSLPIPSTGRHWRVDDVAMLIKVAWHYIFSAVCCVSLNQIDGNRRPEKQSWTTSHLDSLDFSMPAREEENRLADVMFLLFLSSWDCPVNREQVV